MSGPLCTDRRPALLNDAQKPSPAGQELQNQWFSVVSFSLCLAFMASVFIDVQVAEFMFLISFMPFFCCHHNPIIPSARCPAWVTSVFLQKPTIGKFGFNDHRNSWNLYILSHHHRCCLRTALRIINSVWHNKCKISVKWLQSLFYSAIMQKNNNKIHRTHTWYVDPTSRYEIPLIPSSSTVYSVIVYIPLVFLWLSPVCLSVFCAISWMVLAFPHHHHSRHFLSVQNGQAKQAKATLQNELKTHLQQVPISQIFNEQPVDAIFKERVDGSLPSPFGRFHFKNPWYVSNQVSNQCYFLKFLV